MPEESENELRVCLVYHEFDKEQKVRLKEHLERSLPSGFFLWDKHAGVTDEKELSYIWNAVVLLVLVSIKFMSTKMYHVILEQKKKFPEKIIIPIKSNPIDQEPFELMKTASFSSNSIPLASMKGAELEEACANIARELREILEKNKDRLCQLIVNRLDIPTAQQNTGLEIDPTSIVPNLSPDATKQQEMEKS